ncbi:MAG: MFS transporter [Clostridia bacterium]|nr:MFS transporter [Clostridia bacterium]
MTLEKLQEQYQVQPFEQLQEQLPDTGPQLKPRLWTLDFVLICLSTVTVYIAFHSLLPTLPVYIKELGGSTGTAGLALALLTIAAVFIRPVAGWALDGYGRKTIFLSGLVIFLLPSVVFIGMVPLTLLLFLRLIQGFGWGICNTAAGTVASDIVPPSRLGEGLGFYSLTSAFSLAIAPAIGLWLIDSFSFRTLFITCSVLTLAAFALALPIKYPQLKKRPGGTKLVFMEKTAIRPAIVMLLVTINYSSLLSFLALFVRQQGMGTAGIFFTTLAVTTLLSRPLSGRIVDSLGQRGYNLVVLPGILAIVASMLVLAQTSGPLYLVAAGILYGIGFGFVQPTMLTLCIRNVPPSNRGAANATYWTAFDIGVALGSVIWGVVANTYGYPVMFTTTVIPPLLALVVYFKFR